jgi:hypothetical protein
LFLFVLTFKSSEYFFMLSILLCYKYQLYKQCTYKDQSNTTCFIIKSVWDPIYVSIVIYYSSTNFWILLTECVLCSVQFSEHTTIISPHCLCKCSLT